MKDEFLFVILGSDENAYGISRSYYEKFKSKPLLLCSRLLKACTFSEIINIKVIENFDNPEICINTLIKIGTNLKQKYKKLALVPCSDSYMEICVKNKNKLETIYENKFIEYTTLQKFITKDKFYKLCEEYNLKYPKTNYFKYSERQNITKNITYNYPLVLKPNNSNSLDYLKAEFKDKKKVFIIKNKEELEKVVTNIGTSNYKDTLIVQEFIKGDDTCNIVVNCYSNRLGVVVMMSLGRAVLEEYAPKTLGNYAVIISVTGFNKILESIKQFLESIKYKGFSNFDIKYDETRKEYYVFEMNYRQGRSSFYCECAGISLANLIYEDLILNVVTKKVTYIKNEILWLNVPEYVAKKYIKNKTIKRKIKDLIKSKKNYHTLIYEKDLGIKRILLIIKLYLSKIKQYKNYFIKK